MSHWQDTGTVELSLEYTMLAIRFVNPRRRNAFTSRMLHSLAEALQKASTSPEVSCVLLASHDGHFCSGADLTEIVSGDAGVESPQELGWSLISRLANFPKPTLASIEGGCVGGGLSFAVACDFRVAATTAQFALPASRHGIVYALDEAQRLCSLVGERNARRLIVLGENFPATEALQVGLVDYLVDDPASRCRELQKRMSESTPEALLGNRKLLRAISQNRAEDFNELADLRRASISHRQKSTPKTEGNQ